MTIRSPAKFAAIITEEGLNRNSMLLKKRSDILVQEMNRGNRQLGGETFAGYPFLFTFKEGENVTG